VNAALLEAVETQVVELALAVDVLDVLVAARANRDVARVALTCARAVLEQMSRRPNRDGRRARLRSETPSSTRRGLALVASTIVLARSMLPVSWLVRLSRGTPGPRISTGTRTEGS